jgi:hypothetical protein
MNKDRKGVKPLISSQKWFQYHKQADTQRQVLKPLALKLVVMVQLQKVLKPVAQWHKDKQ